MQRGVEAGVGAVGPIRVLIDARMCDGRHDGVSRYVIHLMRELRKSDAITPVALCAESVPAAIRDQGVELCMTGFSRAHRPAHRRLWWEQTRLASVIRRAGVDLYHATWNTGVPLRCPVPAVLTVHDLIPLADLAEYFPSRLHRLGYRASVHVSIRASDHIVTVSDYVRNDCIHRLRIAASRVTTVHNGVEPPPDRANDPGVDRENYVLYVGGAEKRKNVAAMFDGLERLWHRGGNAPDLWLTGTLEQQCPAARARYESLKHKGQVRFLGAPDDAELDRLLSSARALLMLSTAEGFGLPVLEALAHGCPAVVSDRTSLPEVVGDAGLVVDPDDPQAVAQAIDRVITDRALRANLIDRGLKRAASFSWTETAKRTTDVYRVVLAPFSVRDSRLICSGRRLAGRGT